MSDNLAKPSDKSIKHKLHELNGIVHDVIQNDCIYRENEIAGAKTTERGSQPNCVRSDRFMIDKDPGCRDESNKALSDKLSCSSIAEVEDFKCNHVNITDSVRFLSVDVKRIRTLDLSRLKLHRIPEEISNLVNLLRLNLSYNDIVKLPTGINHLNKLRSLNLSHNRLSSTPECLTEGYLGALSNLDISYNFLKTFSVEETALQLLKNIDLSNNLLESVPKWLFKNCYNTVEKLDLSNNTSKILRILADKEIINDIKLMKNSLSETLRWLRLSMCSLSKQNLFALSAFVNVSVLHLSNDLTLRSNTHRNALSGMSMCALPNFEKVTELYMSNVHLDNLSDDIKRCTSLKILDVSQNDLTKLPPELCSLKDLNCFIGSNNFLLMLPDNFGELKSLKKLYLSSNHLSDLPQSMNNLKQLKVLDLYENVFEHVPDVINHLDLEEVDFCFNYVDPRKVSERSDCDNVQTIYRYERLRKEFIKNTPSALTRLDCHRPMVDDEWDNDNNNDDGDDDADGDSRRRCESLTFDEDFQEDFTGPDENRYNLAFSYAVDELKGNADDRKEKEEEDWDKDYDSDEYFNPDNMCSFQNAPKAPIFCCNYEFPIWSSINCVNAYIPSEYHPKCISLRKGKQIYSQPAEGQFDDA